MKLCFTVSVSKESGREDLVQSIFWECKQAASQGHCLVTSRQENGPLLSFCVVVGRYQFLADCWPDSQFFIMWASLQPVWLYSWTFSFFMKSNELKIQVLVMCSFHWSQNSNLWMYRLFIHSIIEKYLGAFLFLKIIDKDFIICI